MANQETTPDLQDKSQTDSSASDESEGRGLSLKTAGLGIAGLIILGFLVLMAFGLVNKAPVTGLSGFTRINNPAPQFVGQLYDGDQLDLSQHIGKPIVINFWASWCVPCRDEQPVLEATWRAYKESGVLFVGVNIQDGEAVARRYIDEFDVTYPNVIDADGRVTVEYGVVGIPVTFFINKQGIVERRFVGAIRETQLAGWIEDLIAGVVPSGEVDVKNPEGFRSLN